MRYSSTMITGTVLRGKGSRKKVPPLVVRPLRPFFLVVRPYPPPLLVVGPQMEELFCGFPKEGMQRAFLLNSQTDFLAALTIPVLFKFS